MKADARLLVALALVCGAGGCTPEDEWIELFNGEDLSGWTPKIRGSPLGEDPYGTFRVEDGLLTVGYEGYETFDERFGHLFYHTPYSRYHLRVEYRFVGEQAPGGPGWAVRNSGVMFHAQSPESMGVSQDFPISLEAQFLGGNGVDERPTANLCTPGTHVRIDGELIERHCTTAEAPTVHGDGWVTFDLFVVGDSLVAHVMGADTVLVYTDPVVGGGSVDGFDVAAKVDGRALTSGYIALQSESHPIQFRQMLLKQLPGG